MRHYTVLLHPTRPPALVREGFAWGALLLGGLWLLGHRAWLAGLVALAAAVACVFAAGGAGLAVVAWAAGLFGNDLRRWSLLRRGYGLAHVVAAPDAEAALARLLAARPDLMALAARGE